MQNTAKNSADEKPFIADKAVESQKIAHIARTRGEINEITNIMQIIGVRKSGEQEDEEEKAILPNYGTKYIRVEEDGSLSFNRDFMIEVLKEHGIETSPKMSNEEILNKFIEKFGDELKFFIHDAKIKIRESSKLSATKHKHILPEAA